MYGNSLMKFFRRSSMRSMPSSSASASIVRSITYVASGPPGAAVRVGRRRVREDAGELDAVVRDRVRTGVDPGSEERDAGRDELEVRPHRGLHAGPDSAVIVPSFVAPSVYSVTTSRPWIVASVVLRALLRPLHRAAEPARERDGQQLLRVDVELRAEAAADVGRDDPQLRLVHAETGRGEDAQEVRHLGRRTQRHVARRAGHGEHGPRLDRVRDQPRLAVRPRDDHVGARRSADRSRPCRAATRSTRWCRGPSWTSGAPSCGGLRTSTTASSGS